MADPSERFNLTQAAAESSTTTVNERITAEFKQVVNTEHYGARVRDIQAHDPEAQIDAHDILRYLAKNAQTIALEDDELGAGQRVFLREVVGYGDDDELDDDTLRRQAAAWGEYVEVLLGALHDNQTISQAIATRKLLAQLRQKPSDEQQ